MSNEDTNNKEGEEMFRNVLFTMVCGLLLGGGLIGCGEDSPPAGGGSGSEGEGDGSREGEGEGDGSSGEGEGEGSSEGEGEGPLPPGGDGEPCGDGNTCQDGLSCLTCEEANVTSVPDPRSPGDTKSCEGRICTCPQWFEGRWWAEFEPRATDGHEYPFSETDQWRDQTIELQQNGCVIRGPNPSLANWVLAYNPPATDGRIEPPPRGFYYKNPSPYTDIGEEKWITFVGELSVDHQIIRGTCDGDYLDRVSEPDVFFHMACDFTLTRN